jgi:hypothetical protein
MPEIAAGSAFQAGFYFLACVHVARRAAAAFKPGFEFGNLDLVEGALADFDAQRAGVQRGFAAPVGTTKLLQRERAGFVQTLRGHFYDVFDALAIAEADDASAGLAHAGIVAQLLRFIFAYTRRTRTSACQMAAYSQMNSCLP